MRIIAGTARSLPLKTIEGLETRPTTDKIKETLFNMLQNDVPGCYFLDLFAGSGQIGLEAISRGALYAVFIENNRKAAKCIEDNIAFTKFTKESRLLTTDVISGISSLEGKYTFDIIFMDPSRFSIKAVVSSVWCEREATTTTPWCPIGIGKRMAFVFISSIEGWYP